MNNSSSRSKINSSSVNDEISLHLTEGEKLTETSVIPQRMIGPGGGDARWSFEALASGSEEGVARVIAGGSFAQVGIIHLADVKIAVKEMQCWHPSLGDKTESAIWREIKMLECCSVHPNVVEMLGYIKTNSRTLMMMPCASTNIDSMIELKPLSDNSAKNFTGHLLSALEFLHGQGIAHRDIKPANLLVAEETLMLADFGIADKIPACGFFDEAHGTKSYMAPEALNKDEGAVRYGLEVDMWATGIVIHEMLSRWTPFRPGAMASREDEDAKEEENILAGTATFHVALEGTPALDLIAKLLVVDTSKRLTAAAAAEHPWLGGLEAVAACRAHVAAVMTAGRKAKEEARMRQMGRRRVVRVRRPAV